MQEFNKIWLSGDIWEKVFHTHKQPSQSGSALRFQLLHFKEPICKMLRLLPGLSITDPVDHNVASQQSQSVSIWQPGNETGQSATLYMIPLGDVLDNFTLP